MWCLWITDAADVAAKELIQCTALSLISITGGGEVAEAPSLQLSAGDKFASAHAPAHSTLVGL